MITGIGAEPRRCLIVEIGFVGNRPDAEVLKKEQVCAERRVVQLDIYVVSFSANVVDRSVIDDRQLRCRRQAQRKIAGRHRPLRIAGRDPLAVRGAEAVIPEGALIQHERPLAARVGKASVNAKPLPVAEQRYAPIRTGSMIWLTPMKLGERGSVVGIVSGAEAV